MRLFSVQIGGFDGMQKFVHTPEFKAMNVGFGLDEGIGRTLVQTLDSSPDTGH